MDKAAVTRTPSSTPLSSTDVRILPRTTARNQPPMHLPQSPSRPSLPAILLGSLLGSALLPAQAADDKAPPPTAPASARPDPATLLAQARLEYELAVERERERAIAACKADRATDGRTKHDRLLAFRATGKWPVPSPLYDKVEQAYLRERKTLDAAYERCLDALLTVDEERAAQLRIEMDRWANTDDRRPWIPIAEAPLAALTKPVASEASASTDAKKPHEPRADEPDPDAPPALPVELPIELPSSYRLAVEGMANADVPLLLQVPTKAGPRQFAVDLVEGRFHALLTVHDDGLVGAELGLRSLAELEPPADAPDEPTLIGSHVKITQLRWKAVEGPAAPVAASGGPEGKRGQQPQPAQPKPPAAGDDDKPAKVEAAESAKPKRHPEAAEAAMGTWTIEGNELVAGPGQAELVFGDANWTDYDLTLEAMATVDGNGFQIRVMRKPSGDHVVFSAGALSNRTHRLLRQPKPKKELAPIANGHIDRNRWYRVEIKVRKGEVTVFLDGREIRRGTNDLWQNGRIALFSQGSQPRFRNIRVALPDGGKVLWEGLPSRIR